MANASGKFISDVRKIGIFSKHSPMKSKKDFLFSVQHITQNYQQIITRTSSKLNIPSCHFFIQLPNIENIIEVSYFSI